MDYLEKIPLEEYLVHYGVKGMKWGVRRYQNDDGSLTERGKKRFEKVNKSSALSKRDTHTAKKILRKNIKENNYTARQFNKVADIHYKKADKYVWKSEAAQKKVTRRDLKNGKVKPGSSWLNRIATSKRPEHCLRLNLESLKLEKTLLLAANPSFFRPPSVLLLVGAKRLY